jgi:flagellin-like hook-associated protein FlgL
MDDLVKNIQDAMSSRAKISLTTDGRIRITNQETHAIIDFTITTTSPTGDARAKFNDIFSALPSEIPGLTGIATKALFDPTRYLRLGDEDLGLIDNDIENLLKTEATIGARGNRLSTIISLFSTTSLNVEELKSSVGASNYAELITLISQQQLILQSALGVGAKVLTPSLIDFLI